MTTVTRRILQIRADLERRLTTGTREDVLLLLGEHRLEDAVYLLGRLQEEMSVDFRLMRSGRFEGISRQRHLRVVLQLADIVVDHLQRRLDALPLHAEGRFGANRREHGQ